jgi:hypothetical protein
MGQQIATRPSQAAYVGHMDRNTQRLLLAS